MAGRKAYRDLTVGKCWYLTEWYTESMHLPLRTSRFRKKNKVGTQCHRLSYSKYDIVIMRKPKHPCGYPGCTALTENRFCEEHTKKTNQSYEKYERGVIVPVEEVHHKLPLSEGGTHDQSNLISLCKSCHSAIHAKNGRFQGRR